MTSLACNMLDNVINMHSLQKYYASFTPTSHKKDGHRLRRLIFHVCAPPVTILDPPLIAMCFKRGGLAAEVEIRERGELTGIPDGTPDKMRKMADLFPEMHCCFSFCAGLAGILTGILIFSAFWQGFRQAFSFSDTRGREPPTECPPIRHFRRHSFS